MPDSNFHRRQMLTFKVVLRAERVKLKVVKSGLLIKILEDIP